MATDYYPYVGDVGTIIEIDMGEDLTSWLEADFAFKVKKADDTTATWSAVTVKPGGGANNNILIYTIVEGDFSIDGKYFITPYGNNNAGWKGHGKTVEQRVYPVYG